MTESLTVEEYYCPECGWLQPEYQAGDPALCPNCGVEYPANTVIRGSEPPTDEQLMELTPGEHVTVELTSGERLPAGVRDYDRDRHTNPVRLGSGAVTVGLLLDRDAAAGLFRSPRVRLTAHHADKNPARQSERVTIQSYKYREETDRAEVVAVEREVGPADIPEMATRERVWQRCPGWNDDGSKCDRKTPDGEHCHDHEPTEET